MRDQDLIITLVILAVSGLSTLLQKKRQARRQPPLPGPPRGYTTPSEPTESVLPPVTEAKPFDLEEQLRRIFEGDRPAQPPVPPPLPIEEPHRIPPPLEEAVRAENLYSETEEPAARAMAHLTESAQAHLRATHLSDAAAIHLHRADEATTQARPALSGRPRGVVSGVAAAAIAQLRNPQSVQQAFVTATILERPRAFASSET